MQLKEEYTYLFDPFYRLFMFAGQLNPVYAGITKQFHTRLNREMPTTNLPKHVRKVQAVRSPLLHGDVLIVHSDPLAGWPAQTGLLLQSPILIMVQVL